MTEENITARLKNLEDCLEKIKTLLAWQQLKQAESRPGEPPAFILADSTEGDLKNQYSWFTAKAVELHSLLNDPSRITLSKNNCSEFKRQLLNLETQVYQLNLGQRFIKF